MPRSFWKGYLKLSFVTCPVALMPALSEGEKVKFHTLNRATGNRIVSQYVDAETGEPVERDEQAKGYQSGDDEYVLLEDEELDAVKLESTRTIDIDMFVPKDQIPWIFYERPYYVAPDDPVANEAFSVIREAMRATGMVGISRVVLFGRERAVMLEPRGKGIVGWTLRYGDEVRPPEPYFEGIETDRADPKLMDLAKRLIEERTTEWSDKLVRDPVQTKLKDIIATKKKKAAPKTAAKKKDTALPSNVVNIMDALKRSVAAEKAADRGGGPSGKAPSGSKKKR